MSITSISSPGDNDAGRPNAPGRAQDGSSHPTPTRPPSGPGTAEDGASADHTGRTTLHRLLAHVPVMARIASRLDRRSIASLRMTATAFAGGSQGADILRMAEDVAAFRDRVARDFKPCTGHPQAGQEGPARGRGISDLERVLEEMDAHDEETGRSVLALRTRDKTEILASISLRSFAQGDRRAALSLLLDRAASLGRAEFVCGLIEQLNIPGPVPDRDKAELFPALLKAVLTLPDAERAGALKTIANRLMIIAGGRCDHARAMLETACAEARTADQHRKLILYPAVCRLFGMLPEGDRLDGLSRVLSGMDAVPDGLRPNMVVDLVRHLHGFPRADQAAGTTALLEAIDQLPKEIRGLGLEVVARQVPRLHPAERRAAFAQVIAAISAISGPQQVRPLHELGTMLHALQRPADRVETFDRLLDVATQHSRNTNAEHLKVLANALRWIDEPYCKARFDALLEHVGHLSPEHRAGPLAAMGDRIDDLRIANRAAGRAALLKAGRDMADVAPGGRVHGRAVL